MPDPNPKFPTIQILIRLASDLAALQNLRDNLDQMSYSQKFGVQEIKAKSQEREDMPASQNAESSLTRGLRLVILPERLRATLQTISNWLDAFQLSIDIEIRIPPNLEFAPDQTDVYLNEDFAPARRIQLRTDSSKDLAEVLMLVETILPAKHTYLHQAFYYVKQFGELPPAAKANLYLLRHTLNLSEEETEALDERALGKSKTLQKKYDYYTQELSETSVDDFTDDFWQAMADRAHILDLPEQDASFLNRKHRGEQELIREQKLQQEVDAEKAKKNDEMKRFDAYQKIVRQVILNDLATDNLAKNESFLIVSQRQSADPSMQILFFKHLIFKTRKFKKERELREELLKYNSGLDFNKKQLKEAREHYGISEKDANAIMGILVDRGGFDAFSLSRD